jgi:hypothetical protein
MLVIQPVGKINQEKVNMATINQFVSALNLSSLMELTNSIKEELNSKLEAKELPIVVDEEELDYNYFEEDFQEEYEKTYICFFPWEETDNSLEELFLELSNHLKIQILGKMNLPDILPHPWFGGKGLVKLLREVNKDIGKVYIYLTQEIGWTLDNLRKLKTPVTLAKEGRRNWKQREAQMFFLKEHHINIQIKLLEIVTKDFSINGEVYSKSSNDLFLELVETWYWIFENFPSSLKGIRVRDIFSYYEDLKKMKINLEPPMSFP